MTQSWPLRSLTFSKDVKLARMNRGPLPWPQKGGCIPGGAACGLGIIRSQSELCARVGAAGDCFHKWICCPVGEQTVCQSSPEVFSDRFFRKSQYRNGLCKLEKQEEACEILCSSAGCQSVGELRHVIFRGLQAPDPSSLGV